SLSNLIEANDEKINNGTMKDQIHKTLHQIVHLIMRDKPTGQTIVFTSNLISILQNREFISQIYSKTIGFGETQVNLTEGSIPYDVVSVDLQIIQWGNNPFAFIQNVTNATFVSVDMVDKNENKLS